MKTCRGCVHRGTIIGADGTPADVCIANPPGAVAYQTGNTLTIAGFYPPIPVMPCHQYKWCGWGWLWLDLAIVVVAVAFVALVAFGVR